VETKLIHEDGGADMMKPIGAFCNYMNEPKISFQDIVLVMKVPLRVNSAYNTRRSAAKITIWNCVRQIQS
jgi:hypothetical protein